MRALLIILRFLVVTLSAVLLIPFLAMIALRSPELFFRAKERENMRRRFQQARQWVLGRWLDDGR